MTNCLTNKRRGGALLFIALLLAAATTMFAQQSSGVVRIPLPNNSTFPISKGVWVPVGHDTLYLSGSLSAPKQGEPPTTTETQTETILQQLSADLAQQGLSLGDVVMMHVYIVADPKTNTMDFKGFMAAYSKHFGTEDQPNKPARTAMQVAALAAPGALVEIEVIAARPTQSGRAKATSRQ